MPAHLSVTGIEEFYQLSGKSLFTGIRLPVGVTKSTLVNNILHEAAPFETIYPDGEYLAYAIKLFFLKWERTFTKWYEALQIEYNPLENYDRNESWTSAGESAANLESEGTSLDEVTAYDSETLQTNGQTTNTNGSSSTGSTSGSGTSYIHGNIGVTTSQQMLEAELKVQEFSIYQKITDMFLEEFCIMVY